MHGMTSICDVTGLHIPLNECCVACAHNMTIYCDQVVCQDDVTLVTSCYDLRMIILLS